MDDKKYTIFIIDDDKFLLELYSVKLTKSGHDVHAITSGISAIEKMRNGSCPDIIILDIIMPIQDGIETLKIIRDEKLAKEAVVVMLTNENSSTKIDKANTLGVDGYIVKATTIPSEVVDEVMRIAVLAGK